jgi:hypothetical protein
MKPSQSFVAVFLGLFLLVLGTPQDATGQVRPVQRPVAVAPTVPQVAPLPQQVLLAWQFPDIRVTVLGANTVRIDWVPLQGANQYVVKRNDVQIGPAYSSSPTATQPMTATDNAAPANSTLGYSVTAFGPQAIAVRPGSVPTKPGAAPAPTSVTGQLPLQTSKVVSIVTPVLQPPPISGWADMHAHVMANLGFGGKLIQGGVDAGSLLPSVPTASGCATWVRAVGAQDALGDDRPTAGGVDFQHFTCGNDLRKNVIGLLQMANDGALVTSGLNTPPRLGFPIFDTWPQWNDITHQKMWWEWIRRARDGGQRVMVALAVNNRLLGEAVQANSNGWAYPPAPGYPGDGPTDDLHSGDMQVAEIKAFVARHPDFMEVAYTSADLERIARSNRIAIVLGVELDNIGNLLDLNNVPPAGQDAIKRAAIPGAIQHLYDEGVRYVLPIHVIDNLFGGTAVYQPIFNLADYRENKHYWALECAPVPPAVPPGDVIDFQFNTYNANSALAPLINALHWSFVPNPSPQCSGHRNMVGLDQTYGVLAIKEFMRRGMIVDVDHMSTRAVDQVLSLAETIPYPINSGHNGLRRMSVPHTENQRTPLQLQRIAGLHGIFGLGSDGALAPAWEQIYQMAMGDMGTHYQPGAIGFGTDLNGLVKGPKPAPGRVTYGNGTFPLPRSTVTGGAKQWDYNTDGVAHYGMLPEFIWDVHQLPAPPGVANAMPGATMVDSHLFRSADYFWHMWQICEAQSSKVH